MSNGSVPLSCISLFSGCGGLDIGVEAAGFRVAVATDIEKTCAATYTANFSKTPFLTGSIGMIDTMSLLRAGGLRSGDVDLLVGGPPCPAFSKSRFYRTEKPRALDDPVAAETVGGYLRVLGDVRPKAFLLENVRGLAYGVHRDALEHIIATASSLGYHVRWGIVNAADYGVPQIRERCIVLGSLYGDIDFPETTHAKTPTAERLPWTTAGEAIGDIDTEENAADEGHFAGGKYNYLLADIPPGENYLYFTQERGHPNPLFKWRSRYWSFLLKLSPEMPSWTIQARRSNNMGPLHWRNRILRIEEVSRLQTFPDGFKFSGTVERQWRQIGNAVPPLLAQHFGKTIARHLRDFSSLSTAA
ncbi:DNA cytosine methyltransferase [Rhizobium leguminosarum bv. viciae]|nr:DNA cytosine methyltransferase [Rhizobium leguminosarum bv. viciae]